MLNANTWFEIPVGDIAAARHFYEALLGRTMGEVQDFGGETIAVFAHDKPGVGGCLIQHADHQPTSGGTLVYLDCGPSVQTALDRAQAAGGRVVMPRAPVGPGMGYAAQVQDPQGNLVGLHAAD